MNDDVKSHELPEGLVVESEHLGVVGAIVKSGVSLGNVVLVLVAVVEDDCGNARDASADVEGVFEGGVPVLALVDTIAVSLGKLAEGLAGEDTHGELGHGVHGLGEALDEVLDLSGDLASVKEFSLELLKLRLVGELASEEEPEGSLGQGLLTTRCLGGVSLDLVEVLATVGDTVEVVELGGLIEEAGHASHSTDDLAHGDIAKLSVTVLLLEVVEHLLLLVNGVFNLLLEGSGEISLAGLYQVTA